MLPLWWDCDLWNSVFYSFISRQKELSFHQKQQSSKNVPALTLLLPGGRWSRSWKVTCNFCRQATARLWEAKKVQSRWWSKWRMMLHWSCAEFQLISFASRIITVNSRAGFPHRELMSFCSSSEHPVPAAEPQIKLCQNESNCHFLCRLPVTGVIDYFMESHFPPLSAQSYQFKQ